jgi:hypothetical protein
VSYATYLTYLPYLPAGHYRTSCHCGALYLRILRRHLEHGESVPYERRLDV